MILPPNPPRWPGARAPATIRLGRIDHAPGAGALDHRGLLIVDPDRRRHPTFGGNAREMGLGSAENVSLAEAREQAENARKLVRSGVDRRRPSERWLIAERSRGGVAAARIGSRQCL